jgi:hypothetical protein
VRILRNMPPFRRLAAALPLVASASFAQVEAQAPGPAVGTVGLEMIAGSGPFYGSALDVFLTPSEQFDVDLSYRLNADDLLLQHTFGAGFTWHATDALATDFSAELSPTASADTVSPAGQREHFSFGRVGVLGAIRATPALEDGNHPARALIELDAGLFNCSVAQSVNRNSATGGPYNQVELGGRVGAIVGATAVRVRGAYYLYDRDLSQIAGVRVPPGGSATGDETILTRPQQFDLRASVRQRFGGDGSWTATLSGGYTQYVLGNGGLALAGVRVLHSFGRSFRGFGGAQVLVERLSDAGASPTTSAVGSAGLELDF